MSQTDYMTSAEFKRDFPEFRSVWDECDEMIDSYLCKAQQRLDPAQYGAKLNQAHGLLTAHTLALSPTGQMARMSEKDGLTTYGTQLKALTCQTVLGVTVSGGLGALPWL